MAVKKTTKNSTASKSRVSSRAKSKPIISRPIGIVLAVLLVIGIAVVGIAFYFTSFAANWNGIAYNQRIDSVYWARLSNGTDGRCIQTNQSGKWCTGPNYKYSSGLAQWSRQNPNGTFTCATIWPTGVSGKQLTNYAYLMNGVTYWNGQEIRISETDGCDAR